MFWLSVCRVLTARGTLGAELRGDVRGEWDELKQHDVVFLVTVRPPEETRLAELRASGGELSPADTYGLVYVRGAEIIEVRPAVTPPRPVLHGPLARTSMILRQHCWSISLLSRST
jgi:hypothetical protein